MTAKRNKFLDPQAAAEKVLRALQPAQAYLDRSQRGQADRDFLAGTIIRLKDQVEKLADAALPYCLGKKLAPPADIGQQLAQIFISLLVIAGRMFFDLGGEAAWKIRSDAAAEKKSRFDVLRRPDQE